LLNIGSIIGGPIDLKSMIGRSLTYCFRIKKDRTITAG
jgi:hypothetical protein